MVIVMVYPSGFYMKCQYNYHRVLWGTIVSLWKEGSNQNYILQAEVDFMQILSIHLTHRGRVTYIRQ